MISFIAAFTFIAVIMILAKGFGRNYWNRQRLLRQMEDQHERLRQKRKDLLVFPFFVMI